MVSRLYLELVSPALVNPDIVIKIGVSTRGLNLFKALVLTTIIRHSQVITRYNN